MYQSLLLYHFSGVQPIIWSKLKDTLEKIEAINKLEEIENPVVRETLPVLKLTPQFDIHYHGDLPSRSGLGSSSSFCVGLLACLQEYQNKKLNAGYLAKAAFDIERKFIGDTVGLQDQIAARHGGFNFCKIDTDGTYCLNPVNLSKDRLEYFARNLLLLFTGK